MPRSVISLIVIFAMGSATPSAAFAAAADYPTEVVADYVIGCLASNGETQDMLRRCSCSIDAVSSIIPYDLYERADTIIRMRQVAGDMVSVFRSNKDFDQIVK